MTASTALKSALHKAGQPYNNSLGRILTIVQESGYGRTNVASKIRSLEHFNAQILLYFAHDLYSVVELEVCVLWNLSATLTVSEYSLALCLSRFSTSSYLPSPHVLRFSRHPGLSGRVEVAYPVQVYIDATIRINSRYFSAQ